MSIVWSDPFSAYLKFVANPQDEVSFKRLVQLLPGIAAKGADKLWQIFSSNRGNEAQAESGKPKVEIANPPAAPRAAEKIAPALQACAKSVPKKAAVGWAQFATTIAQLEDDAVRGSAAKMLRLVMDAGYDDYLQETYDNYERRLDEIQQLAEFAFQFGTVEDFLTQLALLTNVEAEEDNAAKSAEDKIKLSTIHQAKGLEFEIVFVIMLCDGLFPSTRSIQSNDGEEEERRLFYVAVTRAKKELYLTYPMMRAGFGSSGKDTYQTPSRFLAEIPAGLLNEWNLQ